MINNVLEEIKKLRIQRTNAQTDLKKLYVNPTHFNMNKDIKAHRTVNNINDLYGTSENERQYINVGESNYKNTLFTGDKQKDFRSTVSSASKDGIYKSDYFNKFYGIPKNLKILNDDNTLYYEKKLGKTTEFDYAIGNMTDDFDRQAGLQSIVSTFLKKRKESKAEFQTDNAFHKEFNKQVKPPVTAVTPTITKTVNPVTVSPAFAIDKKQILNEAKNKMDKIKKSEETRNNMTTLISGTKMNETLKNVLEAQHNDATKQTEKKILTESLNKMNVPDIKQIFKDENLPIPKGNKDEIIKQLVKYRKENKGKFTV